MYRIRNLSLWATVAVLAGMSLCAMAEPPDVPAGTPLVYAPLAVRPATRAENANLHQSLHAEDIRPDAPVSVVRFHGNRVLFIGKPDFAPAMRILAPNGDPFWPADPATSSRALAQAVELVGADQDLTGDGEADFHFTGWSGGAHCCITHYVLDPAQQKIWQLDQGDGDPFPFVRLTSGEVVLWLADDAGSSGWGAFANVPVWWVPMHFDGHAFSPDLAVLRRHAQHPDAAARDKALQRMAGIKAFKRAHGNGAFLPVLRYVVGLLYAGDAAGVAKFFHHADGDPDVIRQFRCNLADDLRLSRFKDVLAKLNGAPPADILAAGQDCPLGTDLP